MSMNLRCDDTFVQDEGWHVAAERYANFICQHGRAKTVYLELGVGVNTPGIIKYPFWRMTTQSPSAIYVCINPSASHAPEEIARQAICVDADVGRVLAGILQRPL